MRFLILFITVCFIKLAYGSPAFGHHQWLLFSNSEEANRHGTVKRQICQWWETFRFTHNGWQCVSDNKLIFD
jgi:hypothetical protein